MSCKLGSKSGTRISVLSRESKHLLSDCEPSLIKLLTLCKKCVLNCGCSKYLSLSLSLTCRNAAANLCCVFFQSKVIGAPFILILCYWLPQSLGNVYFLRRLVKIEAAGSTHSRGLRANSQSSAQGLLEWVSLTAPVLLRTPTYILSRAQNKHTDPRPKLECSQSQRGQRELLLSIMCWFFIFLTFRTQF